ncbi:MAG: hypothetical protein Q4G60_10440, partial [bacterium]|nr:hypothetical protein [bacterium]
MNIYKYTSRYKHLANDFKCGNNVIDGFLKNGDALDENQGITYVMLSDHDDFMLGYYNIEVGRVDQIEAIGEEKSIVPMGGAVNINYLAIHSDYQHQSIIETEDQKIYHGDILLRDCEKRIVELRKSVGISFVTLYS